MRGARGAVSESASLTAKGVTEALIGDVRLSYMPDALQSRISRP